jgi:hypothetical protein
VSADLGVKFDLPTARIVEDMIGDLVGDWTRDMLCGLYLGEDGED